jgi:DNA-binding SARP family transcriptional activator
MVPSVQTQVSEGKQRWMFALGRCPWRGLMRVYARTGRGDLALRQYRECVEVLRRELDAAPSIETELLREAIREGRTESPSLPS